MKKVPPFFLLALLASLASCQMQECSDEVVCETVHTYGVPLDPSDWSARGQNGQVVSMRNDGVTVTRSYEEGILHGNCTYSFPHRDVVQKNDVYNRGVLMQENTHYPNGLPEKQIVHESPQKKVATSWYESGSPRYREEYVNGAVAAGEYYNSHHQVESRVENSNGTRTHRDGQGQLVATDHIENGSVQEKITYHPDGSPAAVTPYVQGKIEGERRTFLPGGEPSTVEQWTNNVQHGNTVVFEQGEKRADVPYSNGLKQGVEKRYRGNAVSQEINWVNGEQHGPSYSYVGNTKQTTWYFKGKNIPNKQTFDMMSNQ